MEQNDIQLQLSRHEAIVLFELASRFTETDELNIADHSEEQVLWNISSYLEKILSEPFSDDWLLILQSARNVLKDQSE